MSRCWLEGEWRAWLDRELPPAEMQAAERHVAECARCTALVEEVRARATKVSELMTLLEPVPEATPVTRQPVPSGGRRGIAAALVLAAVATVLLLLPERPREESRTPPVKVLAAPPAQSTAQYAPPDSRTSPSRTRASAPRPKRPKHVPQYYVALDDDPIDSGVVLRVALADTGQLADVIYDEQGRPRAVRPLN